MPSAKKTVRLGDLLVQSGAITKQQLSEALAHQMQTKERLGSTLLAMGVVDERTLAHVLAQQMQLPSATAAQLERATKAAIERITRATAERLRTVPLRIDGDRLWVAMADPTDDTALQLLERESGLSVRPMVAPDVLIEFGLGTHYGVRRKVRVIETRDAGLLDVDVTEDVAVYDPHAPAERETVRIKHSPAAALGFLDERAPVPPRVPAAAKPAPPAAPGDRLRARLLAAAVEDEVFDALLDELAPVAGRVAVLLLRAGVMVAHRGRGIDPRSLQLVRFALQEAPTLARVIEAGAPYIGPLPSQLGTLFQDAGAVSGLVLPLTMGKKPIGVVLGGNVSDRLPAHVNDLQRAAHMVDLALHIGHLRGRLAKI